MNANKPKRSIEVNGEVWYGGDRFQGPNGKATLKYFDYLSAWGMLDDGKEVPYTLSWLQMVGWEYKRIDSAQ